MENLTEHFDTKITRNKLIPPPLEIILGFISSILIISVRLFPIGTDNYTTEKKSIFFEDVISVDSGQMFLFFASNLGIILALFSFLSLIMPLSGKNKDTFLANRSVAKINFVAAISLIPLFRYLNNDYNEKDRLGTYISSENAAGYYVLEIAIIFGILNSLRVFLTKIDS